MRLAEPLWLLALVLVPMPWLCDRLRPRLAWPTLAGWSKAPRGRGGWPRQVPLVLRALAIAGLSVALARPQSVAGQIRIAAQGVAIIVAIDHSTTMETRDFPSADGPITRLKAARETFAQFVRGRPDDLIGLVAFARLPETSCPPTLDHAFLVATARALEPAGPLDNGTNLGDAVAWALHDIRPTRPDRKVLILLTDGREEIGPGPVVSEPLDPEQAARLVGDLGLTLHTIAIGRPPSSVASEDSATSEGPDFALLRRMAELGNGRAFVAANEGDLEAVFREIDRLEKSPLIGTIRTRYHEWYAPWAAVALAALTLDRFVTAGRLRRVP